MKSLKPGLIKIITLIMTSSLIIACSPTPEYTKQECDSQARKQEYAQKCLKYYPPGHSYFIYSGGHGGYSGGGYYSPVRGKPGIFAPVKSPSFAGRSGFGSFGRGGFGLG